VKSKLKTLVLLYVGGAFLIGLYFWNAMPSNPWGLVALFLVGPPLIFFAERFLSNRKTNQISEKKP
jgi:hypothetical protein